MAARPEHPAWLSMYPKRLMEVSSNVIHIEVKNDVLNKSKWISTDLNDL